MCWAWAAPASGPVFQDGFESGKLGPAWTASGTNDWRAAVTTDFSPAAGLYHLVLDDSVNDANYSVTQTTLSLDLSNKKNVVLPFQSKSLGNEPNAPPAGNFTGNAAFDGVSLSVDGGVTWRALVSLANVPTSWTTYSVTLDATVAALGGSFNANTLIRFSEYDNSPAPIDGIAFDEVSVVADDNLVVLLDMPSTVNGSLALSSTGLLVNSSTVSLVSNLGVTGRPCLDLDNGRAYVVNGPGVRAFDVATGLSAGTLALPVTQTGDWAQGCVRWGLDGLAVLGSGGKVYLARWSSTIPMTVDTNGNGIPDAWEATWFNSLSMNMLADSDGDGIINALEYVFNTSPTQASGNPVQMTGVTTNGSGQKVARLVFPRRTGLAAGTYGYETSTDLQTWTPAVGVTETVLTSQTINGVNTDAVQADVVFPPSPQAQGFVRIRRLLGTR